MNGHDRHAVLRNRMSTNTIHCENSGATEAPETPNRADAKKAKPPKKTAPAKKAGSGKAERANKKAEVIALIKRAKRATLAEIMATTGWQPHTVRGFR
jgi:hypothetical protein